MALISIDPEMELEYIPKFERENSKDPLIVKLKFMNHAEYIEYISVMTREMGTTTDPEKQSRISKAHDRKKFIEHVVGFENWNKLDGTKEKNDAGAFYDRNETNLIYEIQSAYREVSVLTDGQRKN